MAVFAVMTPGVYIYNGGRRFQRFGGDASRDGKSTA